MPAVSPKSYSKRPSVSVGHDDGSTATSRTLGVLHERQRQAAEVGAAAARGDHDVGQPLAGQGQLLLGLEADDRLVQQHVVEHRAERVVRVVPAGGVAHGVGDGQAERARRRRVVDRRRHALGAPRLHDHPPVGLRRRTMVRTMYTLHSRSYCAQAKASAVPHWPAPVSVVRRLMPSCLVVEGLRHGGVGLVRAGRAARLVLVVDARRRAEGLLQPVGPARAASAATGAARRAPRRGCRSTAPASSPAR